MLSATRRKLAKLVRCTSGNAVLLVGLGMPVLIGGTGLAVDTAQWYMFKRELQLAADQSAIAGAWARAGGDTGTAYQVRAGQEFDGNIDIVSNFTPVDTATLADYNGGTANSVVVTASMQATLPFTNIFLRSPTTINVSAQAIWESNAEYTACLTALHKTAGRALWFNGGPLIDIGCSVASMSDASNAIATNGSSGPQNITGAIAGGGIVDRMDAFANAPKVENYDGLEDPYEGLTPPDNPTPRTLSCLSATPTWNADFVRTTVTSYKYYQGQTEAKALDAGAISYDSAKSPVTSTETGNDDFTSAPVPGPTTAPANVVDMYKVEGRGPDTIYEEVIETVTSTYVILSSPSPTAGSQLPGTYTDFEISCDTTLAGGIYVIDGGKFKLNAGNTLTGTGVMFVLKDGAEIDINGTSSTFLTPMDATQLIAAGVSAADATKMENMLIFEDPDSSGSQGSKINGTANLDINGIIYMPNSNLELLGTMGASTVECLMILASTLQIGGTADLKSACPAGKTPDVVVGGGDTRVRLVS